MIYCHLLHIYNLFNLKLNKVLGWGRNRLGGGGGGGEQAGRGGMEARGKKLIGGRTGLSIFLQFKTLFRVLFGYAVLGVLVREEKVN